MIRLDVSIRKSCPSCNSRLSPFAAECPVCGLLLTRQALPRPLLFQASAIQHSAPPEERKQALSVPALGRVTPVVIPDQLPPPTATRSTGAA